MFKKLTLMAVVSIFAPTAWSQDADSPLTSLLEPEVGICVELHNLSQHVDGLQYSDVVQRMRSLPMYKAWTQSGEFNRLKSARAWVEKVAGKPPREFALDLLGHSVVLAISPTDKEPKGLFLTRAANEGVLEHFVAVWRQADKQSEFSSLKHNGHSYSRRTKTAAKDTVYFASLGRIFVLSDHEPAVKSAIDRYAARSVPGKRSPSLADVPVYQAARKALSEVSLVTVFVNPRVWDQSIDRDPDQSPQHRIFRDAWQRCRWIGAGLRIDRGVGVELLADYESKDAPDTWTRIVERTGGNPDFLAHVPANALLAMAGRHDLSTAYHFAVRQTPAKQRQAFEQIGLNVLGMKPSDLIDELPANWGMYIVPRQELKLDVSPVDGVLAVELPSENRPAGKQVRRAIHQGLSMGLVALSVFYSSANPDQPSRAITNSPDHPSIKWIENLNAYELATAVGPRYLAVSSHRSVAKPFLKQPPQAAAGSMLDQIRQDRFPEASQVLFVNIKAIREFVASNREFFNEQTIRLDKTGDTSKTQHRLERVEQALGLVDAGYASLSISSERLRVSAGLIVSDGGPRN